MENQTSDKAIQLLRVAAVPEVLCKDCFEKHDATGEVKRKARAADDEIPGLRAHLIGCPACHEEYESLRELVRGDEDVS